jgi:hypothetical protein
MTGQGSVAAQSAGTIDSGGAAGLPGRHVAAALPGGARDIARTFPEPLLRLMGYARGAYALGYVDDLRDPLDVLFGKADRGAELGALDNATRQLRQPVS